MTDINNTGIVAVGKPTTSVSAPSTETNDNGQTSAYSAYTNNFNYGYNYTTGQYDPAAYAQYCNAYNQYYGYNQQYQYDATTGQYNYYPTGQTTPVAQTSQNQMTTQTPAAVNTPASTASSVQQSAIIGPQLPPPPPTPASSVAQTVANPPYTYSATPTTASSVSAVVPPPPPPPVPISSSYSSAMFPQQANMTMPATPMIQPSITSYQQFGSSTAIQPSTNSLPFNTGVINPTAGSGQSFNNNMSTTAAPAVQATQFTVPPPSLTTTATPNYGYGYDYNYYNQQQYNTSMNTTGATGNQISAPINTNYGQQNSYSNQQQNNFQNYQQGQQMPNQQQSYNTGNQMQYNQTNHTNQSYSNSYNWMDAYKVNDNQQKQANRPNTGNNQTGQKLTQQNNLYGNMIKKTKNKKNNLQKSQNQSLKQQVETTAPETEKPKEKLVLSKKVGPADASKPKGTFAALLGAVEFEPDEYDQSTESESEDEEPEQKGTTTMGTASFLARASSNANKVSGLPRDPKKQTKLFSTKAIVAPPAANLEFDPEAFGLPTSFTGRLPKVGNTESEAEDHSKRQPPIRESFRPKQAYYDWKRPERNNLFSNKQSDEINDASYEADSQNSTSERTNWNTKDDSNKRFNSNHNNQNSFDEPFQPWYDENIPNLKQPPPLVNRNWTGSRQNFGARGDPDANVSQDPYFHKSHEDQYWNDQGEGSFNRKHSGYSESPSEEQFETNFHKPGFKEWEKPNNQRGSQQFNARNYKNEPLVGKPDFKRPNRFSEKPANNQLFEGEDRDDRFPVDRVSENIPPFKRQYPPENTFESGHFKSNEYVKESRPLTSFAGKMSTLETKFLKKDTPNPTTIRTPLFSRNTPQPLIQELDMAAFGLPTSFAGKITSQNNQQKEDDRDFMENIEDEDFRYGQSSMSRWDDDKQDTDWRKNQKKTFDKNPSNERFSNRNKTFDINSRNTDFVSNDPYFQHSEHFDSENLNDYNEPGYEDNSSTGQEDRFSGKRKSFEGRDFLMEDPKGKLDLWFGRNKTDVKQPFKGRFGDKQEPFKRMKPTSKFEPEPFKRHLLPSDASNMEGTNNPLKRLYTHDNIEEPFKRFQSDHDVNDPFNNRNSRNNPRLEPFKRPDFSDNPQPLGKEPQAAFQKKAFGREHFPSSDSTQTPYDERPSAHLRPLFGRGPPKPNISIEPFKRDLSSSNHHTETFKRGFLSSDVTIEPFKRSSDVTPDRFSNRPPVKIKNFRQGKSFNDVVQEPFKKDITIEPFKKGTSFSAVPIEPFKKVSSYKNVSIEPFRKIPPLSDVKIEPFRKVPASKDSISSDVKIEPFMKKHFPPGKNNSLEPPKDNPPIKQGYPPKSEVPTGRKRTGFTDQPILKDQQIKPDRQSFSHPLVTKVVGTKGSKEISTVTKFAPDVKSDVKVSKSPAENTLITRPPSPKSIIKQSGTKSQPLSEPVKPVLQNQGTKNKDSSTVTNPKPNSTLAFLKSIMNRKAGSSIPTTTSSSSTSTTLIATTKPNPLASKTVTSLNSTDMSKSTDSKMVTSRPPDSKNSIPQLKECNNVKQSTPVTGNTNNDTKSSGHSGVSISATPISKPTDIKSKNSTEGSKPSGSNLVKPSSVDPRVSVTSSPVSKPTDIKSKPSEHFGAQKNSTVGSKPTGSNLVKPSSVDPRVSVTSSPVSKPTDIKSKPSEHFGAQKNSTVGSKPTGSNLVKPSSVDPRVSVTSSPVSKPTDIKSKPSEHFGAQKNSTVGSKPTGSNLVKPSSVDPRVSVTSSPVSKPTDIKSKPSEHFGAQKNSTVGSKPTGSNLVKPSTAHSGVSISATPISQPTDIKSKPSEHFGAQKNSTVGSKPTGSNLVKPSSVDPRVSVTSSPVSKPTDIKSKPSEHFGAQKNSTVGSKPTGSNLVKPSTAHSGVSISATPISQPTDIKSKPSEHFGAQKNSTGGSKPISSLVKPSSVDSRVSVSATQISKPTDIKLTVSKPLDPKPSDDNGTTKTSSLVSKPTTSPKQANDKLSSPQVSSSQSNITTSVNTPSTNTMPQTLYSRPVDHFCVTSSQKSAPQIISKKKEMKADPQEVELKKIMDQVTNEDLKMKMLKTKCILCNVELTSNSMAVQHYNGKNHQKKLKSFQSELNPQENVTSTFKAPVNTTQHQDSNKYCAVCQMSFQTPSKASSHYVSQAHTAKMKQTTSKAVFRCELCNVSVNYKSELDSHLNGAKHVANSQKKLSPVGNVSASVSPSKLVPSIASKSPAITKTQPIQPGNIVQPKSPAKDSINATTRNSTAKVGNVEEIKSDIKDVRSTSVLMDSTTVTPQGTDIKQENTKSSESILSKTDTPVKQSVTALVQSNLNISSTKTPEKKDTKDSTANTKDVSKKIVSDSSAMKGKDSVSMPKDVTPTNTGNDVPEMSGAGESTPTAFKPTRGKGGIERGIGRGGMDRGRGGMERGRGGMERGGRGSMERGRGGTERGRGGMERRGRGVMDWGRGGMERGRGGFVRGRGMERGMGRFDEGRMEFDDGYREPFGEPMPRGPIHRGLGRRRGPDIDRDWRDDFHHHPDFNGPPPRRMRFM